MDITREEGLLAWQWLNYSPTHRERHNLLVHALTAPLFVLGTCAVLLTPLVGALWLAPSGLGAMLAVVALQGRTHRGEKIAPAPFRGLGDILARLFVEQWVTFPRYVLSGEFARAWRAGSTNKRS